MSDILNPVDHELSLGEIFGRIYDLLRKNYASVLPIFASLGIVSTILASTISYVTPSIPAGLSSLTITGSTPSLATVSKYVSYTLANYFVSWSTLYFAAAIGILKMSQSYSQLGHKLAPRYTKLAVTTILSVVIIEAGIFLLIIGAIILGTMLYLVLAVSVMENKSTISAIARSRKLVSGRRFKTFLVLAGVQVFIAITSNLIGGIIGLFFSGEASTMAAVVTSNFVTALAFPLVSASMLVMYWSNRAREEHLRIKPSSLYDNLKPQPIPGFPSTHNSLCPLCSSSVTREEKFCHNCGTKLQG